MTRLEVQFVNIYCRKESLENKDSAVSKFVKKSEEYYNYAMKLFSEERNKASEVLLTSNEYNEASHLFINSANRLYNLVAVSSLITYTILFFLYYFIVPLCLKKGQTFAKKMLHIGVFFKDNKMVTPGRLFARWLFQYIFYLFFCF